MLQIPTRGWKVSDKEEQYGLPDWMKVLPDVIETVQLEYPQPPSPPDMLDLPIVEERKEPKDFIEESLGCTHLDAALMAINQPFLWEPEELDLFENVIAGEPYDRKLFISLVRAQSLGQRLPKVDTTVATPPSITELIKGDLDEIALLGPENLEATPVREPKVQELGEMGQVDVGNWWEEE